MSTIVFGGRATTSLVIERYPARPVPARRYTVEQIPGRSGDLLFDDGAYDNVEQVYEVYIRKGENAASFQKACNEVAEMLLKPSGYQKLMDPFDPDVYRMAYFAGPTNIANILNQFGRAELVFNCKPWRYLKSGDDLVVIDIDGGTITNPTEFESEPLIRITGTDGAPITIGIGNYTITIPELVDGMIIDCELMDCYKGTTNLNSLITLSPTHKFPKLVPGENNITVTGDQQYGGYHVEITPRWRTL